MRDRRLLVYPSRLIFPLPVASVGNDLRKIQDWRSASAMGRRIPFRFAVPIRLLVRVTSRIGAQRDWIRAGYLAQVLTGLPGDPKKQVSRLYFDELLLDLDGAGYPFYLEYWPYSWITDYRLEVWAQLAFP